MKHTEIMEGFHSGYVSITGRPNVGKSTLLNSILGEKIAIVTTKPQTTRNRIIGIKTLADAQIIFMDTPGIHKPRHRLGHTMVQAALEALSEVDVVLYVVEPSEPVRQDITVIDKFGRLHCPVFLVINKIDTVRKGEILPVIARFKDIYAFREIIPVSALKRDGIDLLLEKVRANLPAGPKYYPEDLVTDQIERFMASEIIREKIMGATEQELPYSVAVEIIKWEERSDGLIMISSNIYVERDSQKAIIIGKNGSLLKSIGSAARIDIEKLLNTKVFLEIWVKVKKHWRNDMRLLRELGYK
jgi:GTPase